MTYAFRTFLAAVLATPLGAAAVAQEQAAPGDADFDANMTCAEFNDLTEEDQFGAMEQMAVSIGMSHEAAEDETQNMHMADMRQFCEADPDLVAMDAFQNAMDNPD